MKTILNFFKNTFLEIKLTDWPDLKTTARFTGVVISGIVVFTLIIAGLDLLFFKLRDLILK
ncbi:MAG: preprotein translocase subunit SecE [bacterium]